MAGKKQNGDEEYARALYDDLLHLADGIECASRVIIKASPTRGRVWIVAELVELEAGRVKGVMHRYVAEYPNGQVQSFAVAVWTATVKLGKMVLEANDKARETLQ
jgi:hypothetical protein